jgi:hypothetical protein
MNFYHRFILRLLLLGSTILLRRAEKRSARFRQMLGDQPFVLQIRTRDGVAAYFELNHGQLQLHMGEHRSPHFTQVWASSKEAVRVMRSADETEIIRAMEDGRCRLDGSFLVGMWFNEAMKIARSDKAADTPLFAGPTASN